MHEATQLGLCYWVSGWVVDHVAGEFDDSCNGRTEHAMHVVLCTCASLNGKMQALHALEWFSFTLTAHGTEKYTE